MSIIYNQMELTLANNLPVDDLIEALHITTTHIRITEYSNHTNIVQVHTAEILAEEKILNLTLSRLIDIQTILIEDFDIHHALIIRRNPHMYATDGLRVADKVARHRDRYLIDVVNVHTS